MEKKEEVRLIKNKKRRKNWGEEERGVGKEEK